MKNKLVHYFVIGTFVMLYLIVSIISTIHVIDFFKLSNPDWLAVSLAIAFEIGAAASLSSIIVLDKVNKNLVWFLFILLTGMQMMGNSYHAFTNLEEYQSWVELFGLTDREIIFQKRVLSILSGAVLPVVALGFIKALVDYIKPKREEEEEEKYEFFKDNLYQGPPPDFNKDYFMPIRGQTPDVKIEVPITGDSKKNSEQQIKYKGVEDIYGKGKVPHAEVPIPLPKDYIEEKVEEIAEIFEEEVEETIKFDEELKKEYTDALSEEKVTENTEKVGTTESTITGKIKDSEDSKGEIIKPPDPHTTLEKLKQKRPGNKIRSTNRPI